MMQANDGLIFIDYPEIKYTNRKIILKANI